MSEHHQTALSTSRESNPGAEASAGALSSSEGRYSFLRGISELSVLPDETLRHLAAAASVVFYETGEHITKESRHHECGFIVVSGRVAMLKKSRNGRELVLRLLGPNDPLGLLLTYSAIPGRFFAKTQLPSTLLCIPQNEFSSLPGLFPQLCRSLMAHLLNSLDAVSETARALAHDRVEVRIARTLALLARDYARPVVGGEEYVIDITRQQLADLTGTTPETVIRITGSMQRDEILNIKRHRIIKVLNLRALQKTAEGY